MLQLTSSQASNGLWFLSLTPHPQKIKKEKDLISLYNHNLQLISLKLLFKFSGVWVMMHLEGVLASFSGCHEFCGLPIFSALPESIRPRKVTQPVFLGNCFNECNVTLLNAG